jgi:CRISPR/Cas system-associated exonuclease Cas4 (RecB family)
VVVPLSVPSSAVAGAARRGAAPPSPSPSPDAAAYNPAQQAVIALLGRPEEPPSFPPGLGPDLVDQLEDALGPVTAHLNADDPLWVSKHALASVHGCEAHHVASSRRRFEWNVPAARGTVAHKAIELSVHWQGSPSPMELVDEALARLVEDDHQGAQRFLAGLSAADRAELRGLAVDLVSSFQECFPPLRSAWRPVTESRIRVELFGGALILSGKTDLSLGRPEGLVAKKVIIDLKSGRPSATHREDLRFYALLEAIKLGVPPRQLASYYLESGRAHPEDVTVALLQSALRRTVDGVIAIIHLAEGHREPVLRPGPACRWCPLRADCSEGQAELARTDEAGDWES